MVVHRWVVAGALVLTVVTSAGCGGGGGGTDAELGGEAPSGDPIRVMQWAPDESLGVATELYDAADAAAQSINAAGGIPDPEGGPNRPLEVLQCEIPLTDDGSRSEVCARETIDAEVVAVNGKYPATTTP